MKNQLLLLLLLAFCLFSYFGNAQQTNAVNNFKLSGTLTGRSTGIIVLGYINTKGDNILDTATLKNGTFVFKGNVDGPSPALLQGDIKTHYVDDPNSNTIFLSPGKMTVTVQENDFKHLKLSGSAMQDDMDKLQKQKTQITDAQTSLHPQFVQLNADMRTGKNIQVLSAKRDSLYKIMQQYNNEAKKIDYAFISTHPKSYLSPFLMNYYFGSRQLTLDSAQLFYNSFTPAVKSSFSGRSINTDISARISSMPVKVAPIFTKTDINGNTIDLTSFRGKNCVMLDFWASWCVPCRQATPYLKQLYEKYHIKGLDIIGLSWDTNNKAWKDAIDKDSTASWHQIQANMFLPNDNGMRIKYAIQAIPTYILIDKKGIILGRWTGIGQDEEKEIDKILAANL